MKDLLQNEPFWRMEKWRKFSVKLGLLITVIYTTHPYSWIYCFQYVAAARHWGVSVFLRFPCESDYAWLPVNRRGYACVCQSSEQNKTWRWVSRKLVLKWAGLMCSQQTATDPSSACLNWAPGFIQSRVDLQYTALYKSRLHGRPLQRGHCSSFIHTWTHKRTVHEHAEKHTPHAQHTCTAHTVAEQTCAEG